ncbi:MAG: hypothetical protein R3F48_17520 [Candidatus Zixiibacteriota bacterium]
MNRVVLTISLFVLSAFVLFFVGCSDDDSNPTTPGTGGTTADTLEASLVDVTDVIRAAAPPIFTAPTAAPAIDSFQVWTEGEYPLLEKVFGEDDPQTLHRNVSDFEMFMDILASCLYVDENGDIIEGTFVDSSTEDIGGQMMTMHVTGSVSALESATAIPTAYQSIFGASIDLDYLVQITVEEIEGGLLQFGVKLSDTEQNLLVFQQNMSGDPESTEASLVYSTLTLADSSFEFSGIMHSEDSQGEFDVTYIMTADASNDFSYRMSWFSDDIPAPDYTLLGCIIGGGNKDTEFALKYRQYTPADAASIDSEWSFDEVFGPNYTNGTGLITDYSDFVNEELIIGYASVPTTAITSPWAVVR